MTSEELQSWSYAVDVMGYSAIYWSSGEIDNWNDNLGGNLIVATGFWIKLWRVIKADAAGAKVGAEIGGVVGEPVAGAVIGAVIGSGAAIIKEISDSAETPAPQE